MLLILKLNSVIFLKAIILLKTVLEITGWKKITEQEAINATLVFFFPYELNSFLY
jgi:hypothetical protein